MSKYYCECCKFSTNNKTKFDRHLSTNKHFKLSLNYHSVTNNYHFVTNNYHKSQKKDQKKDQNFCVDDKIVCKYCNKKFKHSSGLSRHVKYYCKKNNDEDLKELVRLLNEQNKQLEDKMGLEMSKRDKEIDTLQKKINIEMSKRDKQVDTLQKKISKLTTKLQINNTNNGIINNNIILNNYTETDISHLTSKDYTYLINEINNCLPKMIERIHFNPKVPENMNVYISNMKDKFIMMYKDGTWKLYDRNVEIDKMFDKNLDQLREWLDGNNQYEKLKKKFEKMETNLGFKENEKFVKENMKLVLYNNRELLQQKSQDDEILKENIGEIEE